MKKRLFAIMLALAMLLAAVPALAEEGTPEELVSDSVTCTHENESVKYVDNNDGTHKIIYDCGVIKNESVQHTFNDGKCVCGAEQPANNQSEENNTPTNGGGEGGEQETCKHTWTYEDAPNSDSEHYCRMHKKTCSKCNTEVWESHEWDRSKQEKVEESTCTKEGRDRLPCKLCSHVTYVSRELKPHTKDNGTVIKPATCTEKGKIKYTCTECKSELPEEEIPALGHDYEYHWGTWDCKTKTITAYRKCKRARCTVMENPTTISVSEKDRDTWYSCGKKYTTVYYKVTAAYSDATVEYGGKAECTYSSSDYCRPDWYYDPCYYNNPCGHWGCGNVCTRYSDCVPCQNYRTTFRVGGYNCLATPKTGDVSVMAPAILALIGAAGAALGKKRR